MTTIKLLANKNKAQIIGDIVSELREHFSEVDKSARYIQRINPFISTKKYAITYNGIFDIGLLGEIQKYIFESKKILDLCIDPEVLTQFTPKIHSIPEYLTTIPLRDYQQKALDCCHLNGRGLVIVGTGGGKTLIIANLINSYFKSSSTPDLFKCIVIVPDVNLVEQTYKDFLTYNVPFTVSKWSGTNTLDLSANAIIANNSILFSQYLQNVWINHIDLFIQDEVHKNKRSSEISKIVSRIKTPNKFGFTGTLPDKKIDLWNIIGKIGPVLYTKDSFSLRTEQYLANVIVKTIKISYRSKPATSSNPYKSELQYIYQNTFRNNQLEKVTSKFTKNILILVNHISHGLEILNKFQQSMSNNKLIYFVRGEMSIGERERIRNIIETQDNIICIAMSSIYSTGINIKNLHMFVFAAGGKAFIRTIQSIGRGLRLHPQKDKLVILDIADQLHYGKRHYTERKKIYEREKIEYSEISIQE